MSHETRWFHDLTTEESKRERATLAQRLIAVLGALCFIVLVGIATNAYAGPILKAEAEGVVVTIYEEACKIKEVSNLPRRATWTEKGKTFEGCIGAHPMFPVLMAYFSDKTVVVLPVEMFVRVTGA